MGIDRPHITSALVKQAWVSVGKAVPQGCFSVRWDSHVPGVAQKYMGPLYLPVWVVKQKGGCSLPCSSGSSPPLLLEPVPRRKQDSCLPKPWAHFTDELYRWMTPQTVLYKKFYNRHLIFLLQDEVLMMKIIWGWGIQNGSPHWWQMDWCYVPWIQTNLISRPHDLGAKFKP